MTELDRDPYGTLGEHGTAVKHLRKVLSLEIFHGDEKILAVSAVVVYERNVFADATKLFLEFRT